MRHAMFWEKRPEDKVQCLLCPQQCLIVEGRNGFCRVRKNDGGILMAENYAKITSHGVDPIEKKPLYHFYPGSDIFSVGTYGCNLRCGFCQNWSIAQGKPETITAAPAEIVDSALKYRSQGSIGIAYTYSEPFMWYEYVYDTAKLARQAGLKNVIVTNGYINPEPLKELLPLVDAMNIDVKGFSDRYYNETCVGELLPVLRSVETAAKNCHVEVTTLLVTGLNDSEQEISDLTDWLAGVDPDIPLHFSRYFPNYQMELPPTPISIMERAREIARKKLNYVYMGNVKSPDGSNTYCPECRKLLIKREGYTVRNLGLEQEKCKNCGHEISLVGRSD